MTGRDGQRCTHPETQRLTWGGGSYGCGACGATPHELAHERFRQNHRMEEELTAWWHDFQSGTGAAGFDHRLGIQASARH
ncbi:hypothetical protein [Streptomyces sp. HPF1205]|uniref:hypothetical protein n=1 Tax=Streptomyces sp. HPF1205 TaxID=2873262 RepID=UPI001CEDC1D4|nr:hypothetical protein [Streptomyces sp. HPF1205]